MNDILKQRLIKHNWFSVIFVLVLIGLLFLRQIILDIFLLLILSIVIFDKTYFFLPFRYKDDEGKEKYIIYDLLPVQKKEFIKYNLLNAFFWSVVSFCIVLILGLTLENICICTTQFVVQSVLVSLFPLYVIFLDSFLFRLKSNILFISWFVYYMFFCSFFNNRFITQNILLHFMALIFFAGIIFVINFFDEDKFNKFFIRMNSRIVMINNMTRCQFTKSEQFLDFSLLLWSTLYIFRPDLSSRVAISIVLNVGLIFTILNRYFLSENLIRIVPISLKEKKLSCDIFISLYLILLNTILSLIWMGIDRYGMDILLRNICILFVLAFAVYATLITFYHKNRNSFVEAIAVALLVLTVCFVIIGLRDSNYIALLGTLLMSFILLIIDYRMTNHNIN